MKGSHDRTHAKLAPARHNTLTDRIRKKASRHFTHQNEIILHNRIPSYEVLADKFRDIPELGI